MSCSRKRKRRSSSLSSPPASATPAAPDAAATWGGKGRRWQLVTGQPGCGKTTLVKAVVESAQSRMTNIKFSGFYTDEVLRGGRRIGFDVVTIPDGRRGVLSRKSKEGKFAACPRVGAYSVDVDAFEALALPTLASDAGVFVIDEIGRMELKSEKFKAAVVNLLNDEKSKVFGAITAPIYGHRVPFCDSITTRTEDVATHRIKKSNRDEVREMLLKVVCGDDGGKKRKLKNSKIERKHDSRGAAAAAAGAAAVLATSP